MIIAGLTLVSFVWSFNLFPNEFKFGIFPAIGVAMIILGCTLFLPTYIILLIALLVIGGHNLLDGREPELLGSLSWFHVPGTYALNPMKYSVSISYPILPWLVVPMIGYVTGGLYALQISSRQLWFYILGFGMILLFVILRYSNLYGDPSTWSQQRSPMFTLLSFLNCTKYPPSLLFLLMTLGPALILLALFEKNQNRFISLLATYGRVPFFFYVAHIFLFHILSIINAYFQSGSFFNLFGVSPLDSTYKINQLYGYSLPLVYIIWLFGLLILYPACKIYGNFKYKHRHWSWLSYI